MVDSLSGVLVNACHTVVSIAIIALRELTATTDLALTTASACLI